MADSPASATLHMLQSELNGAKSQWEYLDDRLTNGYKDGYKEHLKVLKEMANARLLEEQREAKWLGIGMFVFSVTSVGFAGGVVGGLIAPWVKKAPERTATAVIRQGVQGIATRTTQQGVLRIVPERPADPSVDDSPYIPASPEVFDHYLETKEELDGCFAIVNSHLQNVINLSNNEQWSAEIGQEILNGFRRNCRLLTDAPDPKQLPDRSSVAKAAELAMWVAWANNRDWDYWNKVYWEIDNKGAGLRKGNYIGPPRNTELGVRQYQSGELNPVLNRLRKLGISTKNLEIDLGPRHAQGLPNSIILDMRKLRVMRLQHQPDLPFTKMDKLDFGWAQTDLRLSGGDFLEGLRDLRPFYIKQATP